MSRVLVTGGLGFIGQHVVNALLREGYTVRILDVSTANVKDTLIDEEGSLEVVRGSVTDRDLLVQTTREVDAVVHLAAIGNLAKSIHNPLQYHDVNVTGTVNLLNSSINSGVKKFVFASSGAVYRPDVSYPITEDEKYGPISPYAVNKVCGEFYCTTFSKTYGIDTLILRFFNVYGPGRESSGYDGAVTKFMLGALRGDAVELFGTGSNVRDYVYVKDVANVIGLALTKGISGVFNVGTGKGVSTLDLVRSVERVTNRKITLLKRPARPGDTEFRVADITKLKSALGYQPTFDLDTGLKELESYLRKKYGIT